MNLAETRKFCAKAHGDQKYGKKAYSFHLRMVESVAVRFGFKDPILRKASWAHDLLEDTPLTKQDLLDAGMEEEVVVVASAVTDEPGATRAEKKLATYPKIKSTPRAVLIKLFDRIANVEYSIQTSPNKLDKYRKEYKSFREHLYDPSDLEAAPLWAHLDSLLS
jgi:(p)ppGpp synthase/HD superfamily hydrolase